MFEIANEADIPQLCELLKILFTQEAEFQANARAQAEGLRRIVASPERGAVLVARDGSNVIGMVSVLLLPSTALGGNVAMLEDMVVEPAQRGRRIGASLLSDAIAYAKSQQCLRITLLTDHSNVAAQAFYTKHGFRHSTMLPMRLLLMDTNEEAAKNGI